MRAIVVGPEAELLLLDRPDPVPAPGEVLVRVHGAGINRGDLLRLTGEYVAPPIGKIPGLEIAGEVVGLGPGVTAPPTGTRVFGIVAGGAQAELAVLPSEHCAVVPEAMDLVASGGIPETFVTAQDALRQALAVSGEVVLVTAAASGVGLATIQLARARGCTVVATTRSRRNLELLARAGAHHCVLVGESLDPDAILDVAGPADVVIEVAGGPYVELDVAVAAQGGRIVLVGGLAGRRADLDVVTVMRKRLRLIGTMLGSRPHAEMTAITEAFMLEVVPLLAAGAIRPVIGAVLPLAEAAAAYELVGSDAAGGKVVLDAIC